MAKVSTSTTVSFADRSSAVIRLELTAHPFITTDYAERKLRLYPPVPAKLATTAGTIANEGIGSDQFMEFVTFSGSDRVTLSHPGASQVEFHHLAGMAVDINGDAVDVALHYDYETDEVVASAPFYGGFQANYTASYRILDYHAQVDVANNGAVTITYGSVIAFYEGATATYEVQPPDIESTQWIEGYRAYSKVIADPDGRWEMPDNWPDSGDDPYGIGDPGPDPENSHDEERPHEIGYVDTLGSMIRNRHFYYWERPYLGSANYRPKYFGRITVAQNVPAEFKTAIQRVNWNAIIKDLKERYSGIVIST